MERVETWGIPASRKTHLHGHLALVTGSSQTAHAAPTPPRPHVRVGLRAGSLPFRTAALALCHSRGSSGIGCFAGVEHLKQSHMPTGPTPVATPADPPQGESKVSPAQLHPHSVHLRMEVSNVAALAALRMANADAPELRVVH